MHSLNMEITDDKDGTFFITFRKDREQCNISFNCEQKQLIFLDKNSIFEFLQKNEFQFRNYCMSKGLKLFLKGLN